jgi:RNA methyltransferase, TrmH family
MLSKNKVKYIKSLQNKKFRQEYQRFLVEGAKSVAELLISDFQVETIVCTQEYLETNPLPPHRRKTECFVVSETVLSDIGTFVTNNAALAVAIVPERVVLSAFPGDLIVALDDVRDPGNLGTILRICDWYGINKVLCSRESAELYNPKVISSSMGSFLRIRVEYAELSERIPQFKLPVLAADMKGENVHSFKFPVSGILLLGNEAQGIDALLTDVITERINIPRYGHAESLNVAIAGAIILDNWSRAKV